MLCMQELFFGDGWITWNIVSDVFILTKGKKSIKAEKNENGGYKMQTENLKIFFSLVCDNMSSYNLPSVTQSLFRDQLSR